MRVLRLTEDEADLIGDLVEDEHQRERSWIAEEQLCPGILAKLFHSIDPEASREDDLEVAEEHRRRVQRIARAMYEQANRDRGVRPDWDLETGRTGRDTIAARFYLSLAEAAVRADES